MKSYVTVELLPKTPKGLAIRDSSQRLRPFNNHVQLHSLATRCHDPGRIRFSHSCLSKEMEAVGVALPCQAGLKRTLEVILEEAEVRPLVTITSSNIKEQMMVVGAVLRRGRRHLLTIKVSGLSPFLVDKTSTHIKCNSITSLNLIYLPNRHRSAKNLA